MIPLLLRQMRWRLAAVAVAAWALYLLEPGFHQHGPAPADPFEAALLAPEALSYTLANLAGLTMLILLAGFIADDRRRGYYRLYFSHPTRPLSFYALRWLLAFAVAMAAAFLFQVVGQLAAWGEVRVGPRVLIHPFLFAIVYGGLVAFLSAALPRADAWVALALFFFTDFWLSDAVQLMQPFTPGVRRLLSFLLPPHVALTEVYLGIVAQQVAWGAALYAAGYGLFWMILAGVLVSAREWP